MVAVQTLYRRLSRLPGGTRLFSAGYARKAPYFRSVRPLVTVVRPHRAEVVIADRKPVRNHLGGVHAIALCNGLEAAMGLLAEATVPAGMRWVPKGMEVEYTARASGPITCLASSDAAAWAGAPEVPVNVSGRREDGTEVVRGTIHLWVTPRKP